MFKDGDKVQLGKGKTVWTVFFQDEAGADPEHVQLKSDKGATRLAKVTDVTLIEAAEKPQETIGAVIRDLEPAHIPGESPAAYKLRTGLKLDGRRTSFGRALLIAIQPKLRPIGVKTRRGQGRKANRA
jgi:hypothetical protein